MNEEERLIALSESGSSVAISNKAGPIGSSIDLLGWRSDFREAFCADLKKMQLGNCANEKSSSFLERLLDGNIVRFKNNTAFSRENSEFPEEIIKREKVFINQLFPTLNRR